eukprot:m.87467 g.87467  ORF g.87467 m.87467 type:complete len:339 (-) comp16408_c1_seq3:862-1878(-)
MAGISSADDWLLDVENSTDAVNAASTPAHKQSDEKNANPFLRQANADQFTSQSNNDSDTSKSQSQANCSMVTTSIKENLSPGPLNTSLRRKSRKLPQLICQSSSGRMKRSVSLSFLPTSSPDGGDMNTTGSGGSSGRIRRRLPDTGQGRLIQQVADKLEEEARVRLEVARELKDEKRKRWKVEDANVELQQECSKLKDQLNERRRECARLQQNFDEEHRLRAEAEAQLQTLDKELRRAQAEIGKLKVHQDSQANDAVYGEEALQDAWQATFAERAKRQNAQAELDQLKRGILKMGGTEVLQQIMASAGDWAQAPTPSPGHADHKENRGMGSMMYETEW